MTHPSVNSIVERLEPCPFCQSEGHTLLRGFRYADECPDRKELAVMRPTCEARAPLKAWNTRTPDPESAAEIERLRQDNEQLNFTFDLQWEADQRAIKSWQAAHPGKERTWPDRCCMVIWLIEELATAESALAAAMERDEETLLTLRHARTFIASKERMHPDGIALYDKCIDAIASAIRSAVSKKTAESGHSPSTHNSESE